MTSIQERQTQRKLYVDEWSTREKLCLASAVLRSGDQNWNAVSRTIKPNADANRPLDWMVPKACAIQYQILLDSVETPKRKKRVAGEKLVESSETAAEYLVRKLTQDHQEDLKRRMELEKKEYFKVKFEIEAIEGGNFTEEELDKLVAEMDLEDENKKLKEEEYKRFLIDREQKKRDYERPLWKSPSVVAAQAAASLKSNLNESGSSNELLETKPSSTPTSPLLTSLLQSPSPLQRSSVLSATPTISNLLNSAPAIPHYSTDSPTLTKLLESRTSPRSTSSSLIDNSISNKTDLQSKQGILSSSMISQSIDPSSQLTSSPRLNKSPISRTPPRSDILSASMRVDSNPDISNVVRCLYMEDVDKKACVGIETTQLLLNQANVDLSKVDEQKLQDEIVDMIVEQQETDGMNIANLSQTTMNTASMSTSGGLPTIVKMEVNPQTESSLQMSLRNEVGDSNIVVLDCDITNSVVDNSEAGHVHEKSREIKIEHDIPIEIAGSSCVSNSKSNVFQPAISQSSSQVPTVIDVEATHSLSLSQAEISVVGISPIKSEPNLDKTLVQDSYISAGVEESFHSEQSKSISAIPTPSADKSFQLSTAQPIKSTEEAGAISTVSVGNTNVSLKEAQIKIGRVDDHKDDSAADKVEIHRLNFNQNVIVLDTDLDLSSTNMSNDIIIDNDTEVIIAKDDSSKSGMKSDEQKIVREIVIKEDVDDVTFNTTKPDQVKIKPESSPPTPIKSETDTLEVGEALRVRDKNLPVEESDVVELKSSKTDSKKVSKPEPTKKTSKSSSEKADSENKIESVSNKKAASNTSERKGTKTASDKKEATKKTVDDEDEVTNDGDDEDDSDEQLLSSLKRSASNTDKKQPAVRKKSSGSAPSNIPIVSDFVDTSSDTHSTGGDDSESTSTSVSATSRINKKTVSREKRDSVNSTTSSSSHHNTLEEKDLRAWKKSIMLSYNRIATHKYASLFLKPITEDQAPGYHNIVKQPIDLLTIKKNIENGTLRTTLDFQRAIMLMFTNALFFNWYGSEVYKMTQEMMMDTLNHIQLLVQTMGEGMPYAQSETESPEKQARTERTKRSVGTPGTSGTLTPVGTKRKRSGMETPPMMPGSNVDQNLTPFVKRRR